jgi:alanine racemase
MTSIAMKQPPSLARDPGREPLRPTWYEIDLDAIAENFRSLRAAVGSEVAIYACLKRNAYGCGAVAVARRLAREGTEGLALGNIYDAIAIRAAGLDLPILLYPTCLPEQAETLRRYDLMASVSSAEEAVAWDEASHGRLKVFVKIDAGAFRAGALPRNARATFAAFKSMRRLELAGAYSHFLLPQANEAHAHWQLAIFKRAVAAADELGIELRVRMVAGTAVVLGYPDMDLNGVDPGRMLYGVRALPDPKRNFPLRPALQAFRSRLILVKDVQPSDAEGGRAPFELARPMRIGLLPLGWGDGFPRVKPDGASVLVRGRRMPLLPPVHLEHIRVDLTEVPEARLGDEVTLVGRQGEAEILIDEAARQWGLGLVEFYALLRDHVPRIYFEKGRMVDIEHGCGDAL